MLPRIVSIVFLCTVPVVVVSAQNRDTDSQTLREILGELRSIHEDTRVTETTQLLVAELEMQQGVVNRATESADNARAKLNGIHSDQKRLASEIAHAEEQIDKATDTDFKNALAQENDRRKANVDTLKTIEQEASTTSQEMDQRLQNAQDKLTSIEDELDAAVAKLGPVVSHTGQK